MSAQRHLVFAFLFLILLGSVSGCAWLEDLFDPKAPDAKVVDQRVVFLSRERADLEVDVAVFNPNAFTVPVAALDYQVFIQNRSLLKGEQLQGQNLPSREEVTLTFPVTLEFSEIAGLVENLWTSNQLDYRITGGIDFDLPLLGVRRVPLETNGSFPVPQLPRVEVAGLKADSLSFSKARLLLSLRVTNPNIFDLNIADFDYGFQLEGDRVAGGQLQPGLKLPAGEQITLEIPFNVNLSDLGRRGFSALQNASAISYSLDFSSRFESSFRPLSKLEHAAEHQGRIRLQR
ncbi:LEA type 2 family protein [Marinospirillum sp.]|uniref:LEA type 2 family protein n=1 Tax=Marinospirillum sp. TaxID=2183934 RepID=UPI00384BAB8A